MGKTLRIQGDRRTMILEGSVLRTLCFLALPSLLMATVQALIPLIDGIFINNVIGGVAAGAISFCGPVINFMNSIGIGMGVAASAIIGQTNGMGDTSLAKRVSVQVLVLSTAIATVLVPAVIVVAYPLTMNVTPEIIQDSRTYLSVSAFLLPFTFLQAQFNAIKNASGKPEAPLYISLVFFAAKLLFNCWFILALDLKVFGAALASVCAYSIVGLLTLWMLFFTRKQEDKLSLRGFKLDKAIFKEVFRVGFPSMLQGAVLQIGFMLMNFETQEFGAVALTGMSISSNINGFAFSIPSAVAAAVTTMVSINMGGGNARRAKKSCVDALYLSLILSVVICAILLPTRGALIRLFSRDAPTLAIADWSLLMMTISSFGFSTCMVLLSGFTGLGNTLTPFVVNVLRIWAIRYVFILLTKSVLGLDAIIIGNVVSNYVAALIALVLFLRLKWVSQLRMGTSLENPH